MVLEMIEIKPDLDKLNPTSPNYDQQYNETIWKAANIEDIKKYLGAPNLVIEAFYDWDSVEDKKWTELSVKFQSISEEIVQKIISKYNLDMTSDYFYGLYNFGVYPVAWESEGRITVDIQSSTTLCDFMYAELDVTKFELESIIFEILKKYNITIFTSIIDNSLCKSTV